MSATQMQTETDLLEKITQVIPADLRKRFDTLVAKRQANTLTADEYAELLHLGDQMEELNVQRIELLVELARLRNVSLSALIDELRSAELCP